MEPSIVFVFLFSSSSSSSPPLNLLLLTYHYDYHKFSYSTLFFFFFFVFVFCSVVLSRWPADNRTTRTRSASRRRQRAPANRCTNAVRSTWPFSGSSRCRARCWRRRPAPPPTTPPITTASTASVANSWNWAERRHRRRPPSTPSNNNNRNRSTASPPRSSGGCHRGATNEESSTEPVTVSSLFFSFQQLSRDLNFIHYSFLSPPLFFSNPSQGYPSYTYNHVLVFPSNSIVFWFGLVVFRGACPSLSLCWFGQNWWYLFRIILVVFCLSTPSCCSILSW